MELGANGGRSRCRQLFYVNPAKRTQALNPSPVLCDMQRIICLLVRPSPVVSPRMEGGFWGLLGVSGS